MLARNGDGPGLYYARYGGGWLAASEPGTLLRAGVPADPDVDVVAPVRRHRRLRRDASARSSPASAGCAGRGGRAHRATARPSQVGEPAPVRRPQRGGRAGDRGRRTGGSGSCSARAGRAPPCSAPRCPGPADRGRCRCTRSTFPDLADAAGAYAGRPGRHASWRAARTARTSSTPRPGPRHVPDRRRRAGAGPRALSAVGGRPRRSAARSTRWSTRPAARRQPVARVRDRIAARYGVWCAARCARSARCPTASLDSIVDRSLPAAAARYAGDRLGRAGDRGRRAAGRAGTGGGGPGPAPAVVGPDRQHRRPAPADRGRAGRRRAAAAGVPGRAVAGHAAQPGAAELRSSGGARCAGRPGPGRVGARSRR